MHFRSGSHPATRLLTLLWMACALMWGGMPATAELDCYAPLESADALPLAREGVWLAGTDSHDVTGDNDDGFNAAYSYLYKDGDEWVLFEEEGPGCVYVVRTIRHKGDLRVYLDGA